MQADSVWLTETSRISGEVHYKSLQMDRGAALNCRVVHNWNENEVKLEDETSQIQEDNPDEKPIKK
jgi:cytoskeletal protein CcmA (bactofilin family)